MKNSGNVEGDHTKPSTKRPYSKPRLEVYGELGQITGSVGHKGATDNGAVKGLMATR
jgi:hypothetical protein